MPSEIRRIVYVCLSRMRMSDYERLGILHFRQLGAEVMLIDATPWLHGQEAAGDIPDTATAMGVCYRELKPRSSLAVLDQELANADLVIPLFGLSGSLPLARIFQRISRAKAPIMVLITNAYPRSAAVHQSTDWSWSRLFDRIGRAAVLRLAPRLLRLRGPDYVVLGGQSCENGLRAYPAQPSMHRIWVHSMDYEKFLHASVESPPQDDIAVFIDEHVGFEQDMALQGEAYDFTPEHYYRRLNHYFSALEHHTGLRVVIAGNPRAESPEHIALFDGRNVVYGRTADLIIRSRLVIAHRSTAIGLAVMGQRPLHLVALRAQYQHPINKGAFDGFLEQLNLKLQLIDDEPTAQVLDVPSLPTERYAAYMESYCKRSIAPPGRFWDIVTASLPPISAPIP